MARQRFDISSKWLIQNQGKGTLLVGGLDGVRRCEAMPAEVIQNRRYPDGLLQVVLRNDPQTHHVLMEIATFPERRALKQAMDDLTLAYSALGHLPELVMLVLRPKGKFRIHGEHAIQSELGTSWLEVGWRTVELWTLPAAEYLAKGDVGVMPWVPLMHFDGPPEPVLEQCAARIERESLAKERTDLLVVSQVLASLRYPGLDLMTFFGGQQTMIESPIWQKWRAEAQHADILAVLKARFGQVPRDVAKRLREFVDEEELTALIVLAAQCRNLEAFREGLVS